MRPLLLTFLLALLPASVRGSGSDSPAPSSPIPQSARQLVLVRTAAWWAATGTLQRYERAAGASWRTIGDPVPVNLGRSGLAWGRGLHSNTAPGLQKREGDGKSPAGVFRLSQAFGVAKALPQDAHGFPYLHSSATTYCVEDTRSSHYNQIIDSTLVAPASAWEQRSEMRRPDGLFNWGVVVQQNSPEIKKASGSCVFLHIWRGPRRPTSGCTSMAEPELENIVKWLDPKRDPVLVQLPEPAVKAVRDEWQLP